jgi:thiol-disulfide isomerase/thioredoxin
MLALPGGLRPAAAAPARVELFAHGSWKRLQAELPRPGLVVFTATWCPTCPEVLRKLADVRRANRLASPLVAVVMDGDGHAGLLDEPHYRVADRLMVFDGDEAALRHTVQPAWRGVTPFVALLPTSGGVQFVAGMPTGAQLEQWLRR